MKNFKIEAVKWVETFHLIKTAESEKWIRDDLHKEGFVIVSIVEIWDIQISGNKFFFEIIDTNGNIKIGTIVSNDVFKAYLKIKYEMKYNLKYIYQDQNTSIIEKERILKELENHYTLYQEINKKQIQEKEIKDNTTKNIVIEEKTDTFVMQKEIEKYTLMIEKVLLKLKNILEWEQNEFFNPSKKELLKNIYTEILKVKTSTNVNKLKQVGEIALLKIWELELEILENKKDEKYKNLLHETNILLKEAGSKKTFIEKDKDLNYIFNTAIKNFFVFIKSIKRQKTKKVEIDTTSTWYLRNKYLLNKYEAKWIKIKKEKLHNFIIYLIPSQKNSEKKEEFLLKEKVIQQNIMILKSRLEWSHFSYTKIVKGYYYFIEKILTYLNFFNNSFLIIISIYSIIFLIIYIWNNIWYSHIMINFNGMYYFIFINILFILFKTTRWLLSLIFNIVIFIFLFIFWVINF